MPKTQTIAIFEVHAQLHYSLLCKSDHHKLSNDSHNNSNNKVGGPGAHYGLLAAEVLSGHCCEVVVVWQGRVGGGRCLWWSGRSGQ